MNFHARAIAAALLLSLVGMPAARGEGPGSPSLRARELTLAQGIEMALRRNPDAASAAAEVEATEAARASARGAFGPKLRAEANAVRWDSAFETSLPDTPGTPIAIPSLPVRDSTTTTVGISLIQPLTSLWTIYEGYRARVLGAFAARAQEQAVLRDVAYQAAEAHYRLLQKRRIEEIARKSVEQVESQVARSRSFFDQGAVGRNDVLRAELGLATARQRLIQASGDAALAQARLAIVTGLPPDTVITPSDAPREELQEALATESLERLALETRPELREAAFRAEQARGDVRAAWSRMIPQISAVASYQRNTGTTFQPENAYFVGLFASWDVWEWGATYYGTAEARARSAQTSNREAKARDGIVLEVRSAAIAYRAAAEALGVARSAVAQAEENFRLESKRYEAHASTSFDVLDAETLLAQARTQEQNAVYDFLIARASLDRAAGNFPLAD